MPSRRIGVAVIIGLIAALIVGALLDALHAPFPTAVLARGAALEVTWTLHLALGALLSVTYVALFAAPGGYAESVMSGAAFGMLWWLIAPLTLVPLVAGQAPQWSAGAAGFAFPAFVAALLQGALIGLGWQIAFTTLDGLLNAPPRSAPTEPHTRIVVVGGGFSGVTATRHLERLCGNDPNVEITLVSPVNYLLFTPMLIEIATSVIEPPHIAPPLRAFFKWVNVVRGEVQEIDMEQRVLKLAHNGNDMSPDIPFDHLVLALGTVPNFYDLPGLEANSFTFKTLQAAVDVRNHVIDMLERANDEPDGRARRAALTFVVAGGGFAGTELVGALNDFVRTALAFYPNIHQEDITVMLVHSSRRILPELGESLAAYALGKLEGRGVTCKCGFRVAGAEPGRVLLNNGESIDAETLVWTAGNIPHPLVRSIKGASIERSAIKTDTTFAAVGLTHVWAIGDCAWIPDAKTGQPALATAQHALVEGPAVARNIYAVLRGRPPKPFHYTSFGSLALLGHHVAVAEVKGMKFAGLLAWVMWRMVYLYRLPTLQRKMRVVLDWLVDMLFPRDIVQTYDAATAKPRGEETTP